MSFNVSLKSGTGHGDDPDDEPTIYEFQTEAERLAFINGVNVAAELTDGWVDGWVEAKAVDQVLPTPVCDEDPGYAEAREFLLVMADLDHDVAASKITAWLDETPPGTNRIMPLVQVARDYRVDGLLGGSPEGEKLRDLFLVVKQALMDC